MKKNELIEVLDELIDSRKTMIVSLNRKRWCASEKAMTGGKYNRQIKALEQIKKSLDNCTTDKV